MSSIDERPVRHQGGRALCAGGQPAGFAHRAVCGQGDRRAAGEAGCQGHDRPQAQGPRFHPRAHAAPLVREGGGLPFVRFPGATITLGPEMRSTGEVMGLDDDLGIAFAKTQATVNALPLAGNVFLSVKDADKARGSTSAGSWSRLVSPFAPPAAPPAACGSTASPCSSCPRSTRAGRRSST